MDDDRTLRFRIVDTLARLVVYIASLCPRLAGIILCFLLPYPDDPYDGRGE